MLRTAVSKADHSKGPTDAVVTLIEYGDYECPYSAQAHQWVKQAQRELGTQLRFVFRNFPMRDIHPHAQHSAEAAEAASAQGQFWEMQDLLFENQKALHDRRLREYAAALGLNALRFDCELAAHVHAKRVRSDYLGAVRSGVTGAPTFFINGVRYDGDWTLSALIDALQSLATAAARPQVRQHQPWNIQACS